MQICARLSHSRVTAPDIWRAGHKYSRNCLNPPHIHRIWIRNLWECARAYFFIALDVNFINKFPCAGHSHAQWRVYFQCGSDDDDIINQIWRAHLLGGYITFANHQLDVKSMYLWWNNIYSDGSITARESAKCQNLSLAPSVRPRFRFVSLSPLERSSLFVNGRFNEDVRSNLFTNHMASGHSQNRAR